MPSGDNFRKPPQTWIVDGDVARADLGGKTVTIDAADLPLVEGKRWHRYRQGVRSGLHARLHYLIATPAFGQDVIFIDKDCCNHRRSNLVAVDVATARRRAAKWSRPTSSQFKGVSFVKGRERWHAYIKLDRKRRFLGSFECEHEAAKAYDDAALTLFGELAMTNKRLGLL